MPLHATCSWSPSAVTLNGTATATATVTLNTTTRMRAPDLLLLGPARLHGFSPKYALTWGRPGWLRFRSLQRAYWTGGGVPELARNGCRFRFVLPDLARFCL